MTDTAAADRMAWPKGEFRTPEMEAQEIGRSTPSADRLSIEEINPLNANLFAENRWQDHFARLRKEDPVHFNELETAGRYWSLSLSLSQYSFHAFPTFLSFTYFSLLHFFFPFHLAFVF